MTSPKKEVTYERLSKGQRRIIRIMASYEGNHSFYAGIGIMTNKTVQCLVRLQVLVDQGNKYFRLTQTGRAIVRQYKLSKA